jgi:hypothetical protein
MHADFKDYAETSLANALKESIILPVLYSSGLACSFVMISEVFLDHKLGLSKIDSSERTAIIMSLLIPPILILLLKTAAVLPVIFFSIIDCQALIKVAACTSVLMNLFPENFPVRLMFPILLTYSTSTVFSAYYISNSVSAWAHITYLTLLYISVILYSLVTARWLYYLLKKTKSTYETIGTSECIATFYALLPFFHFYGTILARGFLGVVVFTDSTESYLAVLQLGELVFTILLGVLPSQIDMHSHTKQ